MMRRHYEQTDCPWRVGSPTRESVDLCTHEYHDAGTSDLLTGLMEQHEKTTWMLRAMLESKIEGSIRLF